MKRRNKVYMILVVLIIVIAGIFYFGKSKNATTAKKEYIIAMDQNYAPFEYKVNGKWKGIDVDLLKAVAKVEKIKLVQKHMDFSGIIPALQAKQVDGSLAAMFITDERKKVLDFSKGYYQSGNGIFVKKGSSIKGLKDIYGKTIAVKKGESGAEWANKNKDKYNLKIESFNDAPSLFQQVSNGQADLGITDSPVVDYHNTIDKKSNLKMIVVINKAEYGFAVPKGKNKELLKKWNEGIKKLKANGTYQKIIKKYIDVK